MQPDRKAQRACVSAFRLMSPPPRGKVQMATDNAHELDINRETDCWQRGQRQSQRGRLREGAHPPRTRLRQLAGTMCSTSARHRRKRNRASSCHSVRYSHAPIPRRRCRPAVAAAERPPIWHDTLWRQRMISAWLAQNGIARGENESLMATFARALGVPLQAHGTEIIAAAMWAALWSRLMWQGA